MNRINFRNLLWSRRRSTRAVVAALLTLSALVITSPPTAAASGPEYSVYFQDQDADCQGSMHMGMWDNRSGVHETSLVVWGACRHAVLWVYYIDPRGTQRVATRSMASGQFGAMDAGGLTEARVFLGGQARVTSVVGCVWDHEWQVGCGSAS